MPDFQKSAFNPLCPPFLGVEKGENWRHPKPRQHPAAPVLSFPRKRESRKDTPSITPPKIFTKSPLGTNVGDLLFSSGYGDQAPIGSAQGDAAVGVD